MKLDTTATRERTLQRLSIFFTVNMKNEISTLEHYDEFSAYKIRIEKILSQKTKIGELTTQPTDKKEKMQSRLLEKGKEEKRSFNAEL